MTLPFNKTGAHCEDSVFPHLYYCYKNLSFK